jgi:hypothetical protein
MDITNNINKKTILDRLLLSTIIDIYLEDPTLFVNGQIFQTTTANSSISFYLVEFISRRNGLYGAKVFSFICP